MFQVELVQDFGKPAKVIEANQIVVRLSNGTPVLIGVVSATTDDGDVVEVSHCKDSDFQSTLRRLNIPGTVTVAPWKGN